ncbi:Oidioi.mRNA.OKI2018_I69.XSR.g17011.t1.cds [Oikopleura dioica]|uniref:Oidioi.mRNA.OKI2018_I69.XSR.g17011.t1.cds n=1 Tax=Oikopleura dioica TaxID=34765 RepID=A0ABN7SS88_OIKDI|nr:Oidioi.mRNA.OKI2018_I69.XSR.g17011.t1.cds [Oikopleura dioica]
MWTCVESRDGQFGQMIRKIVFGDIYENEDYARQRIPIPKNIELKMGKTSKLDDMRSVTVVPMEPEMLPLSALPCSEIKLERSDNELDFEESELMIDEMEDEDAEETHGNSLNLLSADDAARLTEMLVSAQNNCNPQQDLVLTGSISNLLGQGRPQRPLAPAPAKKTPSNNRKSKNPSWSKQNGTGKRNRIEKEQNGDSLTSRYRDTLIHKFDKDELIVRLNRDEVDFRPYFDEQFCFLRLVVVDEKVSNYIYCVNCKQLLCFFAINVNSGGKVQTNTIKKHSSVCKSNAANGPSSYSEINAPPLLSSLPANSI